MASHWEPDHGSEFATQANSIAIGTTAAYPNVRYRAPPRRIGFGNPPSFLDKFNPGSGRAIHLEMDPSDLLVAKKGQPPVLTAGDLNNLKCAGYSCWRNNYACQYFYSAVRIYWKLAGCYPPHKREEHIHSFLDVTYNEIRVVRNLFSPQAYNLLDASYDAQRVIVNILSSMYARQWADWSKAKTEEALFKEHLRLGGQLEGWYNNITQHGHARDQWCKDLRDWARAEIYAALPRPRGPLPLSTHGTGATGVSKRKWEDAEIEPTGPRKLLALPAATGFGDSSWGESRAFKKYRCRTLSDGSTSSSRAIGYEADRLIAEYSGPRDSVERTGTDDQLVPYFAECNIREIGCSKEEYMKVDVEYIGTMLRRHPDALQDPEVIYYWRKLQAKAIGGLWTSYWKTLQKLEKMIGAPLRGTLDDSGSLPDMTFGPSAADGDELVDGV